mmetsp:Transcript_22098/g.65499  ORF Transcript_22098/g.65499 Transcript_22098/m.65499 type:complete len:224 (+) Transcript_22098:3382-4053(+)
MRLHPRFFRRALPRRLPALRPRRHPLRQRSVHYHRHHGNQRARPGHSSALGQFLRPRRAGRRATLRDGSGQVRFAPLLLRESSRRGVLPRDLQPQRGRGLILAQVRGRQLRGCSRGMRARFCRLRSGRVGPALGGVFVRAAHRQRGRGGRHGRRVGLHELRARRGRRARSRRHGIRPAERSHHRTHGIVHRYGPALGHPLLHLRCQVPLHGQGQAHQLRRLAL